MHILTHATLQWPAQTDIFPRTRSHTHTLGSTHICTHQRKVYLCGFSKGGAKPHHFLGAMILWIAYCMCACVCRHLRVCVMSCVHEYIYDFIFGFNEMAAHWGKCQIKAKSVCVCWLCCHVHVYVRVHACACAKGLSTIERSQLFLPVLDRFCSQLWDRFLFGSLLFSLSERERIKKRWINATSIKPFSA